MDWMYLKFNFSQEDGDISGPNGIPDGYVDNYDLGAFSDDWLRDVNDL